MTSQFNLSQNAERLLAAIVESSEDAILAKTLDGKVIAWNAGAELLYGYSANEAIGQEIALIVPPDRLAELDDIMRRIVAGERVRRLETTRVAKDGRVVHVSLTIAPIKDAAGAIVAASSIAHDITEKNAHLRQIEDREERLRSLVEAAVDAIIVIDARGIVEGFNPAAERLFGYASQEICGQNVKVLMPEPYQSEHGGYLRRYLETGEAHIIGIGREVTARRKDGTTFPVQLSVGEMSLRGERKFTGIVHDLTGRVAMEERLREQASLVRLGEMAAVIAHEVKNPLAAVRGAIQVIGKRLAPGSREAGVVNDIIARIDTLNQLVRDLLLFARPPQPHPIPIDINTVLGATIDLLRTDDAHGDVRVTVAGHAPHVLGDAELLKIVFVNLLINGVQAMKGRGDIEVEVGSRDGGCEVVITDTGPGIPPEIRSRLFTPFVTTKARGTGLGLSTVKRLIDAHRGEIRVESPSRGGARVIVRLPLA